MTTELLSDGDIARHLKVSKSCIRGQRFKRSHGLDHWLTIDPVLVGRGPRYLLTDFLAWVNTLERKKSTAATTPSQAQEAA